MADPALIEAMARAVDPELWLDPAPSGVRKVSLKRARLTLAALRSAGMALVPRSVEQMDDAIKAGMAAFWEAWPAFRAWVKAQGTTTFPFRADGDLTDVPSEPFEEFYRAMLAAAGATPAVPVDLELARRRLGELNECAPITECSDCERGLTTSCRRRAEAVLIDATGEK